MNQESIPRDRREAVIRAMLALLGAIIGIAVGSGQLFGQQGGVEVIVNASNPIAEMSSADVAQLFLKRITTWSNGATVVPVDLPESSPVRERFSDGVHGRPTAAIEAFWQRQVFSGRAVPPVQRANPTDVVRFVAGNAGGVGYVPAGTPLPGTVKVLRVTGGGGSAEVVYGLEDVTEAPQPVSRPRINYPPHLRQRGVEGTVVLEYVVKRDGRVDPTSIVVIDTSHPDFTQPAIDLVRRTQFHAAKRDGQVVAVRVQQNVAFTLERR
jgi:TonB family protein